MACNISKKAASKTVQCLHFSLYFLASCIFWDLGAKNWSSLHVLPWYVLPTSIWWPLIALLIREILPDSSRIFIISFAFCYVHIILYPWLPKRFLPCCRNLAFSLHFSIFMKLIKNQNFPKLDVFSAWKVLGAWISTVLLFLLYSW